MTAKMAGYADIAIAQCGGYTQRQIVAFLDQIDHAAGENDALT